MFEPAARSTRQVLSRKFFTKTFAIRKNVKVGLLGRKLPVTLIPVTTGSNESRFADAIEQRVILIDDSAWFRKLATRELQALEGVQFVELPELDALFSDEKWLADSTLCLLIEEAQLALLSGDKKKRLVQSGLPILGLGHSVVVHGHGLIQTSIDIPNRIDVIDRDSPAGLFRVLDFVGRIRDNRRHNVLVLYPETDERDRLLQLLRIYRFGVQVVSSISEAMRLLDERRDFRIAIVGSHIGAMNGQEVIRCLRSSHDHESLAILGLSEMGDWSTAQSYLKSGANDFLIVPFPVEEFYCRVINIVRSVDMIDRLTNAATRDHLTGMHNRRFLFDVGGKLFASMQRGQISLSAGMVDIDHFKAINDTFGHEAGNMVLRRIADILGKRFRKTDVIARIGGEEFAILMVNMSEEGMRECFEGLRQRVAAEPILYNGIPIQVTASFGVTNLPADSLQELLDNVDKLLYLAKNSGRNRVEYKTIPSHFLSHH
jgi:diguanylate cyclase (GGDEF)-like protein